MREGKTVVGYSLLAVGVFAAYILIEVCLIAPRHFKTISGIETQIEQRLPLGSRVSQVKVFLDSENISCDEQPDEQGILRASIDKTAWYHFGQCRIVICFAFKDGQLIRYSVVESVSRP